jgi:hypothetical protein
LEQPIAVELAMSKPETALIARILEIAIFKFW